MIFAALLGQSMLLIAASAALSGQPLAIPMIAIFVALLVISATLSRCVRCLRYPMLATLV